LEFMTDFPVAQIVLFAIVASEYFIWKWRRCIGNKIILSKN
jgi:hypothetical protein